MFKYISAFAANALLSAFIGLIVGILLFFLVHAPREQAPYFAVSSTGIGVLIGTASRLVCCFVYKYGLEHPMWSYVLTFLITLAGCSILSTPTDFSRTELMLNLVIAEPLALLAVYLNRRYAAKLNNSLKRKQAKLDTRPK